MGKELDRAKKHAGEQHADVDVREEAGRLVYAFAGVDLIARPLGSPGTYVCLRAFPKYGWAAGQTQALSEPFDHQAACTARDLAESAKPEIEAAKEEEAERKKAQAEADRKAAAAKKDAEAEEKKAAPPAKHTPEARR